MLTGNVRFLIENLIKTATNISSDLTVLNEQGIEWLRDPIGARQVVFDGTTLNLDFDLYKGGKAIAVRVAVLARTNLRKGAQVVVQSRATKVAGWTTRATMQPWTASGLGADQFGADEAGADGYPSDDVDPLPEDPLWYAFLAGTEDAALTDPFWRFVVTDTANGDRFLAIGIPYVGNFWEAKQADSTKPTSADQVSFRIVDNSENERSPRGVTWSNPLQIYREWQITFEGINTQDLFDEWVPQIVKQGNSDPFFAFFAPESGAAPIVTSRTAVGRVSNRMAAYVIAEDNGSLSWQGGTITGTRELTTLGSLTCSETW